MPLLSPRDAFPLIGNAGAFDLMRCVALSGGKHRPLGLRQRRVRPCYDLALLAVNHTLTAARLIACQQRGETATAKVGDRLFAEALAPAEQELRWQLQCRQVSCDRDLNYARSSSPIRYAWRSPGDQGSVDMSVL